MEAPTGNLTGKNIYTDFEKKVKKNVKNKIQRRYFPELPK